MNDSDWRLALSLCTWLWIAGCGGAGATADGGADTSLGDTSTVDAVFEPATSCGPDAGTPCCSDDLVSTGDVGPTFHAEISTATVTGDAGVGVFDSVDTAAPAATCAGDLAVGGPHECRSSWSLTMSDGSTTRVESSLPVDDVSWLVGQTVYLASGVNHSELALYDAMGRMLVWQVPMYQTQSASDVVPIRPGPGTAFLPFTMSVHVTPEAALCRRWTAPCWLQDVHALTLTTAREVHSLGPGEAVEVVADGLRYRVTDRILASRSRLLPAQCADFGRETWSFDVVALGSAP